MMKVRKKSIITLVLSVALALAGTCSSMAETTESVYKTLGSDGQIRYLKRMKDDKGIWYQNTDDGTYPKGQWIWISPVDYQQTCFENGDAECIYIKDDGYVFNSDYCAAILAGVPFDDAWNNLFQAHTPDGYCVSVSGQWVKRDKRGGIFNEDIIIRHFPELESH